MKKATNTGPDRRKRRDARKIDREKVLELRGQGLAVTDIATHQGVAPSTIWRFLDRTKAQQEALEQFKTGRADVFAQVQAKSLHVQNRILDSLEIDGVLEALTPHQKSGLLHSVNTVFGTAYDKERLERGQSTSNLAVMGRIMGQAHQSLWSERTGAKGDSDEHSE